MIKRLILIACTIAFVVTAGLGCRTARGFGEDMQAAGEKIQDKTDR